MKKTKFQNILFLLVSCFLFCACGDSPAEEAEKEKGDLSSVGVRESRDMMLIYTGGKHRNTVFEKKNMSYYVSVEREGGKHDWLFDGFLFLELKDGQGHDFASYYGEAPARKSEWKAIVDYFLYPNVAIRALNEAIEDVKDNTTTPFTKRNVVIFMPEPIPGQKDWGQLNGAALDFNNTEDRLAACKWYIDYAINRFEQARLQNVNLSGFYWLAEEATNSRDLIKELSSYLKSKKLRLNWIPYYGSDGYLDWDKIGFDKAYLQPNYLFHANAADSRVDEACAKAKSKGMSMEMEFDNSVIISASGVMQHKFKTYIDSFEKNGIWASSDVAYYQGDNAFEIFANSEHSDDKKIFTRFVNIIADRQKNNPYTK